MPTIMFRATVASPGTPQQLTKTTSPSLPQISGALAGQASLRGSSIVFQADPANTAAKSIYIGGPAMSVSTKSNVGLILLPGVQAAAIYPTGSTSLDDFYIDTDGAGANAQGILVTVTG